MIRKHKLMYGSYTNNHWVYIMYQHQNVSLWQTLGTSMGHAGVWQLTVVLTEVGNLTQNKLHYFSRLYTMMKIIGCICISHWWLFLPKEMARCMNQWPCLFTLYAVSLPEVIIVLQASNTSLFKFFKDKTWILCWALGLLLSMSL